MDKKWKKPLRLQSYHNAFTDQVSQNFRDLTKVMDFSNDDFIRTTEDGIKRLVREFGPSSGKR